MASNPEVQFPDVETVEAEEVRELPAVQQQGQELQVRARHTLDNAGGGLLTLDDADLLVKSGILPKTINTPEKAIAIALNGRDLGISATVAFNNIWILDGKPSLSAGLVTALANRANLRFQWIQDKTQILGKNAEGQEIIADWIWEVEMFELWQGSILRNRMSLSWTECVASGWTGKDPWKKHPRAMARARLIVQIIRAYRPDVLMGMHEYSELADSMPGEKYVYNANDNTTQLLS